MPSVNRVSVAVLLISEIAVGFGGQLPPRCIVADYVARVESGQGFPIEEIDVEGSTMYAAASSDGDFRVYDLSAPHEPTLIGSLQLGSITKGVCARGEIVFIANNRNGLRAARVLDPGNPYVVSTVQVPDHIDYAYDVDVVGGVAFVANQGLQSVDVSDPFNMRHLDHYFIHIGGRYDNASVSVSAIPGLAALASFDTGFAVFDIGDPENIVKLDEVSISPSDTAWDVKIVSESELYFWSRRRVSKYHIDQSRLVFDWSFDNDLDGFGGSLEVNNGVLYVSGYGGLRMYDVSGNLPALIGAYATATTVRDVEVRGDSAYLASRYDGLEVVRLRTPCGEGTSCVSDLNGDGSLNYFDIAMFMLLYPAGVQLVDFDQSGQVDHADIAAFVYAFIDGCG